jgi:AcrR family transcriptional regulator
MAPERTSETGLPASIEAAWGRRLNPGKGPRPRLSLERIVEAGVSVAASEGLAAVSMSRVAAGLGASTMSLYRYVAAKDELLSLMVDAALGPPAPDTNLDQDWCASLRRWSWRYHDRLRQHPWVLRIPVTGPPVTPNQTAFLEQGLRALRHTRLAEHEKASTVLLVSSYVRSAATLSADIEAGFLAAERTRDEAMSGYAALLRRLTDPEHFPALHAVLDAGVFDAADDPTAEFTFGLERILDGIAALIQQ